jgi:hypothetical protein
MFAMDPLTGRVLNCAEKNCLAAKAQMALGIIKGKPVSGVVGGGETPIDERKGSDTGTQKETALGRGKGGNSSKRGRAIMFAAARKSNKNAKVPAA